jgi:hypothetical protein
MPRIRTVVTSCLTSIALLVVMAGCDAPSAHNDHGPPDRAAGMGEKGSAGKLAEPKTLAGARAAAVEVGQRTAAQDFGDLWDMFDATGKAAIGRADYVTYATTCRLGGIPLKVQNARLDSSTSATIRYQVMGSVQPRTFVYQDGQWRTQISPQDLATFRQGLQATIAKAKSEDRC